MSDIAVRDAAEHEIDDVARVLDRAWSEFDELGRGEPTYQEYRHSVADVRARWSDGVVIVAEREGRIVGTVHYYPPAAGSTGEDWPAGWASFRFLGVDPGERSGGIGRLLAEECIRRAREDGASVLGLHTSEWMFVARDMYERIGFRRYPELDFHPRPGFVVTAYRLELTDGAL